jgi:hypothetical protein
VRLVQWGVVAALLGLIALGVAVEAPHPAAVPTSSLVQPQRSGQNVRVRSADGKLLVQLGPNLGQGIPYERFLRPCGRP